jgi:heptosyltransferase-1
VRLAEHIATAIVPPALRMEEIMALLAGAKAVVGVDTGLTHLAAALGIATIGLYCATDPARTGIYGCAHGASLGGVGTTPQAAEVIRTLEQTA